MSPVRRRLRALVGATLVVATAIPIAASPVAAAPTELFISEYVEGSSNNKALELYNGTGGSVNLATAGYNVQMFFNGSATAGLTINLTGTVADGDVFVIAQSSASATILAQADQTNGSGWFNGDDAVVLRRGTTVIDSLGQVGVDPGTEWGTALTSTADNTLRRKPSIDAGDPNSGDTFDPAAEWDGSATDTFDGLGAHTYAAPQLTLSVNDVSLAEGDAGTTSFDFTVSLATPAGPGGVTFDIATADNTATAPSDYAAQSLTGQTIAAGATTYTFSVLVNGDTTPETDETYLVNVSNVTGATVNDAQGLGTITNDDADAAPSVTTTVPVDGATNVPRTQSLTVTFSEPVNVSTSWFSLECTTSGTVAAAVTGGPTSFTIDPTTALAYGETCTLTVLASAVTDQDGNDPPDSMSLDFTVAFGTELDPCTQPYTAIPAIQGSGATVALTGTRTTQGVVVGDYEGPSPALRGFFIQDLTGDGDAATSDGLFVFEGSNADTVSVGDVVRVTGTAGENQGQSQISVGTIVDCGTATVAPMDIDFPVASADFLERYEGMLVRVPETMYVTEHFQLGRFGQVVLSSDGRLAQPTNVVQPGAPALTLQAANNLRRIILDDASQQQNPDPILFGRGGDPLSATNTLRGGDTITGLVGVLNFTWAGNSASGNAYRIRPATPGTGYEFQPANARPTAAPEVGGETRVAGLNLLNYFNTFDGLPDNVDTCQNGAGGAATDCRGADTAAEFARQWPKTVAAILRIDPDVIGVNEIENDGYGPDSAIAHLVDRLNEATAPGTFAFIDADAGTGQVNALGTDAIKVGLLYKPGSVTPVGMTAALNTTAFVNGGDAAPRSRPSLAQAFEDNATGERFIVDTNHLKSKGSACDDPDEGDGQGNCNLVRVAAATELVEWLATDPTGTGDPDVLVIGDLNSYAMEDPIAVLTDAGYTNLVAEAIGAGAYSYVFDGQWGYLDHALGNATLAGQVAGVGEYHINADEPSVLDYNTDFKSANLVTALYAPDEFRVSDHDPILIGLDLAAVPVVDEPSVDPEPSVEGEAVVASAMFTDNDASADTCTVDYGDGSGAVAGTIAGGTCTGPSHVYTTYGLYTVTVTVTDDDGSGTNTTIHDVNFDFDGFFQPVDMAGVNPVRAGASVPFKFTIGGDKGLAILAEGSPSSTPIACDASGSAGPLEETVSAGTSGLQYDPATGTYTYTWKTSKGWVNTCRAFTLTLVDGTAHTALFDFTR